METPDTWCLMESDPVIFTELMRGMGVQGVQVEEVYSLDELSLSLLPPIYAFIFLFKWDEATRSKEADKGPTPEESGLLQSGQMYFAKQLIRNACATQAILNISLNLSSNLSVVASTRKPDQCSTGVTLSPELQEFRDFTWDFTPEMRGLALSNCDFIKACHHRYSGFATTDSEMTKKEPDEDSDSFHFVGILPMKDPFNPTCKLHIVEMDGLAPYPRILATLEDSKNSYNHQDFKNLQPDWTSTLCPLLMSRMNQCASSDIRFNLMAITQDRLVYLQEKLSKLEKDSSEYQSLLDDMREEKESRLKNSNMNLLRQHDLLPVIQSFCQKYSFL